VNLLDVNNVRSAEPTAAIRRDSNTLRRWVTFAGIALIVLIIAADSYEAWQDYRRVIGDNEHLQVALSRALTEQTARMVQEVDVVLSNYAGWAVSEDGPAGDAQRMRRRLLSQMMRLPFVYSAEIAGTDGQLLASTQRDGRDGLNLKDREVFTVPLHAGNNALYFDQPIGGGTSGPRTFALSRRVMMANGAFAGVVVARVALDYLAGFYARVNVTPDTSIRLVRADGVTLAQYPPGIASVADDHMPQFQPGNGRSQEKVTYPEVAGHERIEVSQKVEDYPIDVVVSRSLSSVLQPWIQEERSSAARTLTLAVFAATLLMALRSALNRQERMDEERHRLEQELAGVQRVEALGFLAASVAHDFNNVLTAIIGYAELTRETLEVGSASATNIDRLLAATERARLLVRRVLTFDPHRSVSYRPTQIEPIVVEVSQQVQATLPPSIDMKVLGLDESATILGDATEIYQVAMNLCSNAVHAMPGGGTLRVTLETLDVREPRVLALGQLLPGRWVCMSIIDSGIGLADEQIMSIFEPFYTTRQPALGTGIGLTVVRNIILRMNGALNVDSRLGSGTRMAVYWPTTATPAALPHPARLPGDGAGETILVVDDEKELVAITEELLASLSYEPVGFSDARSAIEAFRHDPKRFDAILTDERMQSLRGLDFAKLIHEMAPGLPIILMTGHRDAEIDARAKAAGIAEILDKPLRVRMLREALARQLRSGKG
jgi:signal transduction histidine kinase/CheY-like chemotaxis protein